MGLFKPYSRDGKTERPAVNEQTTPQVVARSTGSPDPRQKSGPTPSRKEAQAARRQRLHPKMSAKERRQAVAEANRRSRMESLEAVENSPERTLVRHVVDSRWHLTEFMLPSMLLILMLMYGSARIFPQQALMLTTVIGYVLYALLFAAIFDVWWTWRRAKKLLDERIPGVRKTGLLMYSMNRQMMFRRFRQPAPRIKPGETF